MQASEIGNVKKVNVDGRKYVGKYAKTEDGHTITNAMEFSGGLAKSDVKVYLVKEAENKLIPSISVGANSTVYVENLTDDEVNVFKQAILFYDQAKEDVTKYFLIRETNKAFSNLFQ
jgi:hypothetical protein